MGWGFATYAQRVNAASSESRWSAAAGVLWAATAQSSATPAGTDARRGRISAGDVAGGDHPPGGAARARPAQESFQRALGPAAGDDPQGPPGRIRAVADRPPGAGDALVGDHVHGAGEREVDVAERGRLLLDVVAGLCGGLLRHWPPLERGGVVDEHRLEHAPGAGRLPEVDGHDGVGASAARDLAPCAHA